MLSQQRLKELLHYDPQTGIFTRLTSNNQTKIGDVVGTVRNRRKRGKGKTHLWEDDQSQLYVKTKIDGKHYMLHRLAWLYVHGHFPSDMIDHIDGNRQNNKIDNLREATNSQNMMNGRKKSNCASPYKGVTRSGDKWKMTISIDGKQTYMGTFESEIEAAIAYNRAGFKYYGEFFRPNMISGE